MEQRRSKRFEVKLPIKLVRSGIQSIYGVGETRNMSSGGVLFATETKIEIGERIEYEITLSNNGGGPVELHCLGKVVRTVEPEPEAAAFEVAATLERYEFVRRRL